MKTAFVLVAIALAGCSGSKDKEQPGKPAPSQDKPESPEVREFKSAVRKFIAESRVAYNAETRYASKDDIKRFCKSARDAYFAIPKYPDSLWPSSIMTDAHVLSISLDVGGFVLLGWDFKEKVDALEKKLDSIKGQP